MSVVRRSTPSVEEFDHRLLSEHHRSLFENDSHRRSTGKQKELVIDTEDQYIQQKELARPELIERLIIEGTSNHQRRRRSTSSSKNSFQIDKLLQDENNDWFFEKILQKFENIRSKKVNRYGRSSSNDYNNDVIYGVERIVERRYYVKKSKLVPKRNQLTSTSDLTLSGRNNRQLSGVSSMTAATTCSQCSSSPPTYVENLRDQSALLRNEISELKSEIEQLQISQQEFFRQLQTHFQSKTDSTTSQNFVPPNNASLRSPLGEIDTFDNVPIPLITGKKSRSISTESQASSSTRSSGTTTPIRQPVARPNAAPSNTSAASRPAISEFMATKNPSIPPVPAFRPYISSKPPSMASTPPTNTYNGSKPPVVPPAPPINGHVSSTSGVPAPPVNTYNGSKPPMAVPPSPVNGHVSSTSSSRESTPPVVPPAPPINRHVSSTSTSGVPAPPVNTYNGSKPPMAVPPSPVNGHVSSTSSSRESTPPVVPPAPPINGHVSSTSSSGVPAPPVNTFNGSEPPTVASAPPDNGHVRSKPSSRIPTPPVNTYNGSKSSSVVPTSPVDGHVNSRHSSIAPIPSPVTEFTASKPPVIPSIPPVVVPIASIGSRTTSVVTTPATASSPVSSARIPLYENELAHRRVLSPRSQIVASSASLQESSDSSSGSASPELIPSNPRKISKAPVTTLRTNDLNDLVRYSSQLELSGFPPPITPVITNPNSSSTFWESVDQYIANTRSTNINTGLPPKPPFNNGNRSGLYNNTNRQLDKYNLEIRPQDIITSSAPLLMPPLDILP